MTGSLEQRWRNLGMAAGAVTAGLFAVFDLYQWAIAYSGDRFHNDFTFYYAAARIGLAHGWASIYDLNLQQLELNAMGSGITIAQLARYISPPPVAWAALPTTLLAYTAAYWAWSALLVIALVVTWRIASPGHGRWRLVHLAAAIGWLPVIYGLQLGQPGIVVALGVAACYALLRADRPFWSGIALGTIALKPQLAFLVPAALLMSGRTRAFWGSVVALGALGLAPAIALCPSGVAAYETRLSFAASVSTNPELTPAPLIGSLAVTPTMPAPVAPFTFVLAIEGRAFWGPVPVMAAELAALVFLSITPHGVPRPPQNDVPPDAARLTAEHQAHPETQPAPPRRD